MKDQNLEVSQKARREFLEKAGKFALYTTPTMMMLMHPSPEAIARSGAKDDEPPKVRFLFIWK